MAARFITFEGLEGVGKTTQLGLLAGFLRSQEQVVVTTREPGGTALGERIRELLLTPETDEMAAETELLLFFAARAEHIQKVIKPALARGEWVLCDRFTDATYAYQAGGRGINNERIGVLENWLLGKFRPHLTLIFDATVEVGMQRVLARGQKDRFERQDKAFFQRIRAEYLRRAAQFPQRYCIIDSAATIEEVHRSVIAALQKLLK